VRILSGESFKVDQVTARMRGTWPLIMWTVPRKLHALSITRSVFGASYRGTSYGGVQGDGNNWDEILPSVATSTEGWDMLREAVQNGPLSFDPDSTLDFKIVGVSDDPLASDWLTSSNSVVGTITTKFDCSGEPGGCPGNVDIEISGSDPDTGQDRLDAVLKPGSFEVQDGVFAADDGFQPEPFYDAALRVRDVSSTGITDGVRLSYTAPTSVSCWAQATPTSAVVDSVEIPDWGASSTAWVEDSSGLASRTTDVTGLTTDQVYWLRLTCGLQEVLTRERAQ
jgi:hypothetical protein